MVSVSRLLSAPLRCRKEQGAVTKKPWARAGFVVGRLVTCARFMICFVFFILSPFVPPWRFSTVTTFLHWATPGHGDIWVFWTVSFFTVEWEAAAIVARALTTEVFEEGRQCRRLPSRPSLSAGLGRERLIFTIPWRLFRMETPRSKTAKSARAGIQVYKYCLKTSGNKGNLFCQSYYSKMLFSVHLSHIPYDHVINVNVFFCPLFSERSCFDWNY